MELMSGDTFMSSDGRKYLIVSAKGFNLHDEEFYANCILIDVERGSMEGYVRDMGEIREHCGVEYIIPNYDSYERKKDGKTE